MRFVFVFLSFVLFYPSFGQKQYIDPYKAESLTYFEILSDTPYGIVVTDNYCSKIYLLYSGLAEELIVSAGCGRYARISPDKTMLAYKKIYPDGKQSPVVFDLKLRKEIVLCKAVPLCGQPVFAPGGGYMYSIADTIFFQQYDKTIKYFIGEYSNVISVSPSGKYLAWVSQQGDIKIMKLDSQFVKVISEVSDDFFKHEWSPAEDLLLFSSLKGDNFVYDPLSGQSRQTPSGLYYSWSPDGKKIIFCSPHTENQLIKGSLLTVYNPITSEQTNFTHNDFPFVFDPVFTADNKLLFHTFTDKTFLSASIDQEGDSLKDYIQLYSHPQPLPVKFYNTHLFLKNKTSILVPGTVPYVHQVYDTPSWHYGYGSCAPSSAIMSVAYFNLLPPWPFTSNSPVVHTSEYGNYVCDKYRFREYYYNTAALTGGSNPADAWGGYGYMWNGSYSPNSTMMNYVEQHDLISNQYWTTACKFDSTVWEINHAFPHSICSYLTTSGHLTLAIGYVSGQHTLIFHDPYGNKNNGYMNFYGQNVYYDWPGYNNGFQNLNGAAWNIKSEGYQKTYNDTLIDDEYYNHGFYIHNQPPSHMRYYRDKKTGGYLNHFWYTYTTAASFDTCYVTWTPSLPYTAIYEILAYIPAHTINATVAKYRVYHANGDTLVVINQQANAGQWVSLGHYVCASGNSSYVKLGDGTGVQGQTLGFDAVQWKKTGTISSSSEAEINEDVRVYPNPAAEVINIYAGNPAPARIFATLKNIAGSIVFSGLLSESSDIFTLKTDRLPTGCYLLSIEFDGKKLNKKIIIH